MGNTICFFKNSKKSRQQSLPQQAKEAEKKAQQAEEKAQKLKGKIEYHRQRAFYASLSARALGSSKKFDSRPITRDLPRYLHEQSAENHQRQVEDYERRYEVAQVDAVEKRKIANSLNIEHPDFSYQLAP